MKELMELKKFVKILEIVITNNELLKNDYFLTN